MSKEVMRRQASDNRYLHKDFHGALSVGLEYLRTHYGDDAVRQYLWQFARAYFTPLSEAIRRRGLVALAEHFDSLYEAEGHPARIELTDDELTVQLEACPAVTHMRRRGYPVSPLFVETTRTVNAAICEDTPFVAELLDYDTQTGRSCQRFRRRQP